MFQLKLVTYLLVLYHIKINFYEQSSICIPLRYKPCKWTIDDPILASFVIRSYVSILHPIIAFVLLKIFSRSEIIFTNVEHVLIHTWCLIFFPFFDLYEKYVNTVMRIKILIAHLYVLCFDIYAITFQWTLKSLNVDTV